MGLPLWVVARVVAVTLLILSSPVIACAQTPIPAAPSAYVTDQAGLLSTQTVIEQNARLRQYERNTGHQILVYIAPTTGGVPIEDWSVRAFEKWKVGRKSLDDGLALFIFKQDRTLRIEVGYGLESKVPDALASRIVRDTIAPAIGAGQSDRGVTDGIGRILALTGGNAAPASVSTVDDADTSSTLNFSPLQVVLIGLFLIALCVIAIRSPWLALMLLVNIFGGRGGGVSGGGFSGGGGRSGGGGASGRW